MKHIQRSLCISYDIHNGLCRELQAQESPAVAVCLGQWQVVKADSRVEADWSDEGAHEGPGLRVAASLQQGPPVLRFGDDLVLQAGVPQEVGQPHLGVPHIVADAHLWRDAHAAGRLAQVKGQGGVEQAAHHQHGEEHAGFSSQRSCCLMLLLHATECSVLMSGCPSQPYIHPGQPPISRLSLAYQST